MHTRGAIAAAAQADARHDRVPGTLFAARIAQIDTMDQAAARKIATAVEDAVAVRGEKQENPVTR